MNITQSIYVEYTLDFTHWYLSETSTSLQTKIFPFSFLSKNYYIFIQFSLKLVSKSPFNKKTEMDKNGLTPKR